MKQITKILIIFVFGMIFGAAVYHSYIVNLPDHIVKDEMKIFNKAGNKFRCIYNGPSDLVNIVYSYSGEGWDTKPINEVRIIIFDEKGNMLSNRTYFKKNIEIQYIR